MNLILLGPPGSGKGTQGAILAERLGTVRVATGDLLRNAVEQKTELGLQAKSFMDKGLLVPDELILGLIDEVLSSPEAAAGIIMDGFPRTLAQAEAVDRFFESKGIAVDSVVTFEVDQEELVRRMANRAAQESRSDDTPEAFRKRLQVYEEQTAPLVAYYDKQGLVVRVEGVGTVEEIAQRVQEVLVA